MTQGHMHRVALSLYNTRPLLLFFFIIIISGDQAQEHNAEGRKDRTRVYPCVSLCYSERQCEHDTTQHGA